jgi:hypothetical protein
MILLLLELFHTDPPHTDIYFWVEGLVNERSQIMARAKVFNRKLFLMLSVESTNHSGDPFNLSHDSHVRQSCEFDDPAEVSHIDTTFLHGC